MRLALCGSSGTGKTTLANFLAEHLSLPINPVGSRSVAAAMGFASPYDVDAAGKRAEFQKRLLTEKVAWEKGRESFVTDRTTMDNITYTVLHDVDSISQEDLLLADHGLLRATTSCVLLPDGRRLRPGRRSGAKDKPGVPRALRDDPARISGKVSFGRGGALLGRRGENARSTETIRPESFAAMKKLPLLWVVVTGGRHYRDRKVVDDALDLLAPDILVQGDATGADELARNWARRRSVPFLSYPADWFGYGKAAGPHRNTKMLDLLVVHLAAGRGEIEDKIIVAAFPGGVGTADCIAKAKRRSIDVRAFGP